MPEFPCYRRNPVVSCDSVYNLFIEVYHLRPIQSNSQSLTKGRDQTILDWITYIGTSKKVVTRGCVKNVGMYLISQINLLYISNLLLEIPAIALAKASFPILKIAFAYWFCQRQ